MCNSRVLHIFSFRSVSSLTVPLSLHLLPRYKDKEVNFLPVNAEKGKLSKKIRPRNDDPNVRSGRKEDNASVDKRSEITDNNKKEKIVALGNVSV